MDLQNKKTKIIFLLLITLFVIFAILPVLILWTPLGTKIGSFAKSENIKSENNEEEDWTKDTDQDSLSNYLEQTIYHTDPLKSDTDGDGFNDNVEISLGLSPLSETKSKADTDTDGLLDYQEIFVYFTDPNNADTDGDGVNDGLEIVMGTNPLDKNDFQGKFVNAFSVRDGAENSSIINEDPFTIKISSLSIEAPVIWTQTAEDSAILEDLKNGISHAYKTSFPGSGSGNGVYFGHSSGYWWGSRKGNYDTVFASLEGIEIGDEITIENITRRYKYKVTKKEVTTPSDEKIFEETDKESITLVTCYPLGTALKRLYIRAEIEKGI